MEDLGSHRAILTTVVLMFMVHLLSGLVMDKNCSCVTKDEVFDLWDRVESLENLMIQNATFPFSVNSSKSDLFNRTENNYSGNINKTLMINSQVISENKEKTLAGYNVSGTDTNTDVLKHQVVSPQYTYNGSWQNRPDEENLSETEQDNNNVTPDNKQESDYKYNISDSVQARGGFTNVKVHNKPRVYQQTKAESLLSEALTTGNSIKLNHSLLSATYSSILDLRNRINELNSTLQDWVEAQSQGRESPQSNHIQQIIPTGFHQPDTRPAINEETNPTQSSVGLVKLVAALEERLNSVESRLSAPSEPPTEGWFTPDGER